MKLTRKTWLAILAGAVLASPAAIAADHADGTAVTTDPAADITDLYAWMPDATHMALVMDVMPFSGSTATFSNATQYVFHTTSWDQYGPAGTPDDEIDVICTFSAAGDPSCWVEDTFTNTVIDYISGTAANAGSAAGITSTSGDIQLFAGPRNDPFFFNLQGFQQTISDVVAAVPTLSTDNAFNVAGCPDLSVLPAGTVGALDSQLAHSADGGAPVDFVQGQDVLSIVLNINLADTANTELIQTAGNTIVSVWASTNHAS